MPELGKAYVQIVPTTKGISSELSKELGGAGEAGGQSFSNKFASVAKSAIAALGLGKIVKDSLEAGGALQQSFGGLDTIYGAASDTMKQYAADAASMGISMNDYAEQAVSFGASLKQAFGEDISGAAEAANQAIKDMADNSAKMGTDIESIQNAYQGFAKQNYTMLDNLKLGYGGTKTEMERLLADAEALSGVHYDIDNLGDVYSAIHVIQEDIGLTGVAADEAKTTFTGSMQAMKASATNLLAALTTGGDIKSALSALSTTVHTFFVNNLIPMLGNLLQAVPQVLSSLGGSLISYFNLAAGHAEELVSFGVGIVSELITGFASSVPAILTAGGEMLLSLADAFLNFDWLGTASDLIENIRDALSVYAGEFLGTDSGNIIGSLVNGLLSKIPDLLNTANDLIGSLLMGIVKNLPQVIESGINLVVQLISGILSNIPDIVSAAANITDTILMAFREIDWGQVGRNIINGIINGLSQLLPSLINAAYSVAQSAWQTVCSFLGIRSPSKKFAQIGAYSMEGFAEGILDNGAIVANAASDVSNAALQEMTAGGNITAGLNISNASVRSAVPARISLNNESSGQSVAHRTVINFEGNLAQLARVLQPYIVEETDRRGISLVNA